LISGTDKVTAIEIHDPLMVGQVGFDRGIMEIFQNYNVSYILKSTNANSITQVIWTHDLDKKMIKELKSKYFEVTVKPVALVSALGTNIAKPGIFFKAAQALAKNNINIECISQSLKQVNMQFVIIPEDYKKAVTILNDALCFN
jgi:aspartate kinase